MELLPHIGVFQYTRIGKWWHKDKEIDIIALNENTNDILFCECKWQNRKTDIKVLKDLEDKSHFVDWNTDKRKDHFAVFSKSGFTKEALEFAKQNNFLLFTLTDLDKCLESQSNSNSSSSN